MGAKNLVGVFHAYTFVLPPSHTLDDNGHDERVNPYLATFSKHGELGRSKSRMGATSSGPLDGAS